MILWYLDTSYIKIILFVGSEKTFLDLHFCKSLQPTIYLRSHFFVVNMNANIMNTQIFHLNKYDLKGHKFIKFFSIFFFLIHAFFNRF